jgi:coenzyme F420-reducing hydrogenase beta subunit
MQRLSFGPAGRAKLEERLQSDLSAIESLDVEEELSVSLRDGRTLRVPYQDVEELTRPACLVCTEFANDYADIVVDRLGAPHDYATAIIRTEKGSRLYRGALSQGYIQEKESAETTELRSERTRMLASVVAMARRKRERGEARREALGVGEASAEATA